VIDILTNFTIGILLGFSTTLWLGYWGGKGEMRGEAIKRDFGQYCPLNAEFAWKGECDATN
jgi:hypothetical protein